MLNSSILAGAVGWPGSPPNATLNSAEASEAPTWFTAFTTNLYCCPATRLAATVPAFAVCQSAISSAVAPAGGANAIVRVNVSSEETSSYAGVAWIESMYSS